MQAQSCFDLGQLYPEAPHLHLPILAAQQLDHPVFAPACTVSGRVHPRSRFTVQVRQEPLGGLARMRDIPPRHRGSADTELADHTDRNRLAMAVQNVRARARQRAPDRDRAVGSVGVCERPLEERAVDRRLGETVGVDHAAAGSDEPAEPTVQTPAYRVGSHGQQPDAAQVFALTLEVTCQGVGERRHQLEAVDAFAPDEVGKRGRVEQDRTGASNQRPAGGERADPVAGEDVEGETRRLQVSKRWSAQLVGVLPGGRGREQAAVRDHDSLGPPGAARGKDRRRRGSSPSSFTPGFSRSGDERASARGSRVTTRGGHSRNPSEPMVLGHQHGRPGVLEHRRQPLRGMFGVQRQVSPARLQNAQETDDLRRPTRRGKDPRRSPAPHRARAVDGPAN